MNELQSQSNLDEHVIQLLDLLDIESESLPEIFIVILLVPQLLNELPEFPDVMEELVFTIARLKLKDKKTGFKEFIVAWRNTIKKRAPEKLEQFDAFVGALNRICDKWGNYRSPHQSQN